MAFWFATAQAKAGGCFFALQFCSVVSVLFPCGEGRRVLAVLRPGVHLWNLAEALACCYKKFHLALSTCSFPFGACICFRLQDWWVDQHGGATVPAKLWHKAERYTDWAQGSLSGPVGVEDLLGHVVSCLHYFVCSWSV